MCEMNDQDLRTRIGDILQYLKVDSGSSKVEKIVPLLQQRQIELLLVLDSLKEFLRKTDLETALHNIPDTGQLLGRLCSSKVIVCDSELFKAVLTCMLCLYKQNPSTQLEKNAKQWVLAQIKSSMCLTKNQEFVVCRVGLDRSEVIDEQLRLLLKQVYAALEKTHSEIETKYKVDGCLPNSLMVDSSLKSVITTVISIPYCDTLSVVWEKLLEVLSNYSNNDSTVVMVYQRLMDIQKQSYSSKECSGSALGMSKRCCYLLWTSYLPSLEQAVLQIVQEAKKFILPSNIKKCLNRHHLISVCAEHSHLHMTVIQMLHTLLMSCSGSPLIADIISSLNMSIQSYISHSQLHSNHASDSLCTRYPTDIRSLVSQLMLNHRDLTLEQAGYHIVHITECIKTLKSHQDKELSTLILLHFKHWYIKAIQMCLVCDKKHVSGCLELISYVYNYTQTEQREDHYRMLQNLIMCLKPLLLKTSLRLNDIKYALEASQSDCKDGERDTVIGQILVSFIFYSSGGVNLTAEILEMVTGKEEPFDNLAALMMAHEYLDIDFCQWPVNKLHAYSVVIDSLMSSVNNFDKEKTDNVIQIKEIISAASEFLMSAKQLIRQAK